MGTGIKLSAILALCLGFGVSNTIFGTGSTPPLFFTPEPSAIPEVLDAINSAKRSIHMEMYRISEATIIDALIQAHERGVDVEVILDSAAVKKEKPAGAFHRLSDAKVNVMTSSEGFSLSHLKTFVVDKATAFVMTLNFTTITDKTRDVGLITNDPQVVTFLETLFTVDKQNALNHDTASPSVVPSNFVLSPVNARDRLQTLLQGAQKNIKLMVENFSDPTMLTELIQAQSRGVKVEVVMPRCDLTTKNFDMPSARKLNEGGVTVRMMPAPMSAATPYIHQKSIVVDGQRAFLGSENFTFNSLDHARELGIIITELAKIRQLSDTFDADFAKSLKMPEAEAFTCPTRTFADSADF